MKAATTKRYYVTNEEIAEKLELLGDIEDVHKVTPYEHDQEADLKEVDYIITTVIDIETIGEDLKDKGKRKIPYLPAWRGTGG